MFDLTSVFKIPSYPKAVLMSLLLITPFWYLNVRIFNIGDKFTNNIELPIILSFCLSVVHLFINYFFVFSLQQLIAKNAFAKMHEPTYMFIFVVFFSLTILPITSYTIYILEDRFILLVILIYGSSLAPAISLITYCIIRGDFRQPKP